MRATNGGLRPAVGHIECDASAGRAGAARSGGLGGTAGGDVGGNGNPHVERGLVGAERTHVDLLESMMVVVNETIRRHIWSR